MRKIVQIDEEKCNGCGLCVPNCHEGAIHIIDGKARLVADKLCDGLGACLGHCPEGAITIIERPADEFDASAVAAHLPSHGHGSSSSGGCPSSAPVARASVNEPEPDAISPQSRLTTWPVKLELLQPRTPFLRDGHLLLTADCAPIALASFNQRFLGDKVVAIACPKFGPVQQYAQKLAVMFAESGVKRVTVMIMEVPCCGGLLRLAQMALAQSGVSLPAEQIIVGLDGEIRSQGPLPKLSGAVPPLPNGANAAQSHTGFSGCPSAQPRRI